MFVSGKYKKKIEESKRKMKDKSKGLIFGGLAVAVVSLGLLVLAQKDKHSSNSIDDFPTPSYGEDGKIFDYSEIATLGRRKYSNYFKNSILDRKFVSISQEFFEEFNSKFASFVFYRSDYDRGSYECNHFALLYKSLMQMLVVKNDANGAIAVGAIVVKNDFEFGGVPPSEGGSLHMVCQVKIEGDWYIVEPQPINGYIEYIHIDDYKNTILYGIF